MTDELYGDDCPGERGDTRAPKFGEWMRGIWASKDSPVRDGMFVRTIHHHVRIRDSRTWYELTDGKGEFWQYMARDTVFLPFEALAEKFGVSTRMDLAGVLDFIERGTWSVRDWEQIHEAMIPRDCGGPASRMNADLEKLAAFGQWCFDEMRIDGGGDIDGGAAQDAAERCGLLIRVTVTESCGPGCWCDRYDDFPQECLRPAL